MDHPLDEAALLDGTSGRLAWLRACWARFGPVLLIFLLSRLAFYVGAFFGSWLLPEALQEPALVDVNSRLALAMHWRWDAVYYYAIAAEGYHPNGLVAYFPFLPLLIRLAATLLGGHAPAGLSIDSAERWPLLAGVLVGHGAALFAFWTLYELANEESGDEDLSRRSVLYTAIFPLALYYAVPYTEGLFLAVSTRVFLCARRGQWLQAGLWAAAASATRSVGILVAPALALEVVLAWRRGELQAGRWRRALLGLLLAPLGLALYMLYLWQRMGDPIMFVTVQSYWSHERVFPLTTLWRGLGYALNPSWSATPDLYARGVFNTLIVFGFLAVLLVSARRWRSSYVLYGTLLFLVILSSPLKDERVMHSLGRYIMVFFPVYFTLARWGRRRGVHEAILLLWLPLLGLLTALYVRWYPVA